MSRFLAVNKKHVNTKKWKKMSNKISVHVFNVYLKKFLSKTHKKLNRLKKLQEE